MQHGNSANNLKPLQFFQPTGKLFKELKNLVAFQINFEATSVNVIVSHKEETMSSTITGSIFILLLMTTQFLLHSIIQKKFMSTTILLKQKLSKYNFNITKKEVTIEATRNEQNGQFNLQCSKISNIPFKCENGSLVQKR